MKKIVLHIVVLLVVLVSIGLNTYGKEYEARIVPNTTPRAAANADPHFIERIIGSDKATQVVVFAVLFGIFSLMVGLLFQRYRSKARGGRDVRKASLSEQSSKLGGLAFMPAAFSSESAPAVLVAHHDNDRRLFIVNTLRLNYRVVATGDGEEAFDKAFEMVPDLVISDRFLPGMDGLKLAKKIKSTEVTSHIPVIVLSSDADMGRLVSTREIADDHLPESFDARDLLLRVHQLISTRKTWTDRYRGQIALLPAEIDQTLPEHLFLFKLAVVLRNYYNDPLFGVEQMTDQLHMTRLQLFRKLKVLAGQSPGDVIRYYRIHQAKQLLSEEGSSVTEVAFKTGFNNLASFTKAFKDFTNKTPVEFAIEKSGAPRVTIQE
jgi:CheY-like chemotaxis protein